MNKKDSVHADERHRTALYIRVSSDEQAKHGLSLDEQKEALQSFAGAQGLSVVGVYADEGCTARKALNRRKALKNLLHDVEAGKIDLILFIKLDRWFRNIADYYKTQEILDRHGVNWLAIQEDYNTLTTAGRLSLNIRLSIAQNESDTTSDRIKFVFEGKKRRREALTGNLPLGYAIDNHKKIVHDENAPIIKGLFDNFLMFQSVSGAVRYLRECHGVKWRNISCRRALKNPAYTGTFYGIENYTEGIIDTDTFSRAQTVLQARRIDTPRRENGPFLFSGLIRCPSCGKRLVASRGHKYPNQTEYKNRLYRCSTHGIEKECDFSSVIMENTLEKYLLENLSSQLEGYATSFKANTVPIELKKYRQDIKRYTESLDRLKDLYVTGCITRETYDKDYQKYQTALNTAKAFLPVERKAPSKQVLSIIKQGVEGVYSQLDRANKKVFWHSILECIDVDKLEKGRGGEKIFRMTFL